MDKKGLFGYQTPPPGPGLHWYQKILNYIFGIALILAAIFIWSGFLPVVTEILVFCIGVLVFIIGGAFIIRFVGVLIGLAGLFLSAPYMGLDSFDFFTNVSAAGIALVLVILGLVLIFIVHSVGHMPVRLYARP